MSKNEAFAHLTTGTYIVFPWWAEQATWGDLRELLALGEHYPDAAEIEWDWTMKHATQGAVSEADGVVIRHPNDVNLSAKTTICDADSPDLRA